MNKYQISIVNHNMRRKVYIDVIAYDRLEAIKWACLNSGFGEDKESNNGLEIYINKVRMEPCILKMEELEYKKGVKS